MNWLKFSLNGLKFSGKIILILIGEICRSILDGILYPEGAGFLNDKVLYEFFYMQNYTTLCYKS